MLKITARDSESFSAIESALLEFDENEVFLRYFDAAVQSEADEEGVTVILRNCKKFKKDLNKKKYIVSIPTTMTIDGFEFIKKYEGKCNKRVPFYSVLVKGHLASSEVNFILILSGFNDDAIRILSNDEELPEGDAFDCVDNKPANCPMFPDVKKPMHVMHDGCHDHHHICPMPIMNCEEESFIVDTLNFDV